MLRSTTQRGAETFSTPRTPTRNSLGRRSRNRFGSRTRPQRSTYGIVVGPIQPSRRSADSSGNSSLPREIFTFTHLPLGSPLIFHHCMESNDGVDVLD